MFDKNHFNQLTSNIEKEDYLNLTIIGPAKSKAIKLINGMTQAEISDSFKAYDVHYTGMLEARMVSEIVYLEFAKYQIEWN